MEVGEVSTLVRIRTDHWPSLAYIDDYLEALYLS
jgi:AP-5 complex subunit beta-1